MSVKMSRIRLHLGFLGLNNNLNVTNLRKLVIHMNDYLFSIQ